MVMERRWGSEKLRGGDDFFVFGMGNLQDSGFFYVKSGYDEFIYGVQGRKR